MQNKGLTLLELAVVVAILAVLAATLLPKMERAQSLAGRQTTLATMNALRDAVRGTGGQPGYLDDMGALPQSLGDLLVFNPSLFSSNLAIYNPLTKKGWRGPYLRVVDATFPDGWNNPIVLQPHPTDPAKARLVSKGQNGILETQTTDAGAQSDDIVVSLSRDGATW
jgi:prepilin-type N-terminal cleavage/methylation domain-containing protein